MALMYMNMCVTPFFEHRTYPDELYVTRHSGFVSAGFLILSRQLVHENVSVCNGMSSLVCVLNLDRIYNSPWACHKAEL